MRFLRLCGVGPTQYLVTECGGCARVTFLKSVLCFGFLSWGFGSGMDGLVRWDRELSVRVAWAWDARESVMSLTDLGHENDLQS
jgi:hypothetical protein